MELNLWTWSIRVVTASGLASILLFIFCELLIGNHLHFHRKGGMLIRADRNTGYPGFLWNPLIRRIIQIAEKQILFFQARCWDSKGKPLASKIDPMDSKRSCGLLKKAEIAV
ncbi:hypothetical protein B0H14DRAFT_1118237 [Mycena olivaceomarginata]|nr:hypothetical protein B0H14DRAFT_1118237 [Mycena olivaceomarginata]